MSIDRQYGRLVIICDDCGDGFEPSGNDFPVSIQEYKDQGGRITRDGDDWVHWCGSPCEPGE